MSVGTTRVGCIQFIMIPVRDSQGISRKVSSRGDGDVYRLKIVVQEIDLRTLALADLIRPGDTVMWGQAGAEPVELTRALMAQRHSVGAFRVFLGVSYSDTVKPEYGDCVS